MTGYTTRTSCRSCGSPQIRPILSLGETPLANAIVSVEELGQADPRFPLDLAFCEACSLVQITEDVSAEKLFRQYVYFSSFSDTVVENARTIARRLVEARHLDSGSLVIELASNDGYLLQHYQGAGVPVLGIEPALNIAEVARARGIETVAEFFTVSLAAGLPQADVVHANNVLAHVPDLNGFVAGIATVLKPDGVAVIEAPYVRDLMQRLEFDTVYHEHLCYFSATALDGLFRRHGLAIVDVEQLPIHGGSLRVFAARGETGPAARALMDEERAIGLNRREAWAEFAGRVRDLAAALRRQLSALKAGGARIAAYGAAAKGTTLLAFVGLGSETIDFVADRSTVKQGFYTPGTHLPIVSPDELVRRMPDYVLLLAWNFAEEIMAQQSAYRQRGGHFIVPLPEVRIV